MPCNDYGGAHVVDRTDYSQIKFLSAVLCAVFTFLDSKKSPIGLVEGPGNPEGLLDHLDWKEAGVTREQVERWWRRHKKEDRARRKREKQEREERRKAREARDRALAKLSPEDRQALGVDAEDDL